VQYTHIKDFCMMKIAFAEQDALFIQNQVKQGFYSNATELVRDAVRRLREQQSPTDRLLAALDVGMQDIEAGRVVPYTPTFMKESIERARKMVSQGETGIKDGVTPY
jgi:antitoxin ParD1/3/4